MRRSRGFVLLLLFLAGCAGVLFTPDPPRVTLADIRVAEVKLLEQKFRLALRIQNPNSFEVHIEGLDFELRVNDQPFSSGVSGKPVTVGPYGTEILEVDAYSDLSTTLRQLRNLDPSKARNLPYRLKGHVRLSKRGLRLPFDHRGEVSIGRGGERKKPQPELEVTPAPDVKT